MARSSETPRAARSGRKPARRQKKGARRRPALWLLAMTLKLALAALVLLGAVIAVYSVVNPPVTHTIWSEGKRLGAVQRRWVDADAIAPVMMRAAVAAEDANFCRHWGFDMDAIRAAIAERGARGGSTISQQVVKNVFLWQGRSYPRKALEAAITPLAEALWSKRRILEIYLNVAEFDEGVFGVEAAARSYFGVGAGALTARQAALLAAVLPDPKRRDAARPSAFLDRRARAIRAGAATIAADGRADCFQ